MDRDGFFLLIGGGIALVSSVITALVQHALSLRADRVRRLRDRTEEEQEKLEQIRSRLLGKDRDGPMTRFRRGDGTVGPRVVDAESDDVALLNLPYEALQKEPEQPCREKPDQQDETDSNQEWGCDKDTALADGTKHE